MCSYGVYVYVCAICLCGLCVYKYLCLSMLSMENAIYNPLKT